MDGPVRRAARAGAREAGAPESGVRVTEWTYADRSRRRGGGPRQPAWRRIALGALMAAGGVALLGGLPVVATALGGTAAVQAGAFTPSWTGPAAFVHPGVALSMPAAGRVEAAYGEGLVAAGTAVVAYAPAAGEVGPVGLPAWARWDAASAGANPLPSGWGWARRPVPALGLCLRRACAVQVSAPAGASQRHVTAPVAGWYFPGWDPLAALSVQALSDLPPDAVTGAPVTLRAGMLLQPGAPAGVLGSSWSALWLLDLPQAAAGALPLGRSAAVLWPGGPAMAAQVAASGPEVAGRVLVALSVDAPGAAVPPARGTATVALSPVTGEWIPASALLAPGNAVAVRLPDGRPARLPVRVLARGGTRVAVADLPSGAAVLTRPWMVRLWL